MVGPNPTETLRKVDKFGVPKTVHYATIASLVPALALCIPHGAITGLLAPALGLIPAGLGAILALYRSGLFRFTKSTEHEYQILLPNEGEDGRRCSVTLERILLALADAMLLGGLIATIVFSFNDGQKCSYMRRYDYVDKGYHYQYYCYKFGLPMLAAYGTVPLIFNAFIHAYLVLQFVYHAALKVCVGLKRSRDLMCSRCQIPIREGGRHVQVEESGSPSMESMA